MAGLRIWAIVGLILVWGMGGLAAGDCPSLISTFKTPGMACGMTLFKTLGYLPECGDTFQVVDLSDPTHIRALWTHSWASLCSNGTLLESSAIAGRWGFITFRCSPDAGLTPGPTGLLILDIANASAPVEQPPFELTLPATGGFTAVVVEGGYAFVAAGTQGLYIYDLSDPLHPAFVSQLDTNGYTEALAWKPGYLFLVDRSLYGAEGEGVVVVDVTRVKNPRRVGAFTGAADPRRIVLDGDLAYLTDSGAPDDGSGAGLWVLDISTPPFPGVVGFFGTSQRSLGLAVAGGLSYIGLYNDVGHDSGLDIVKILNPYQMTERGFFHTYGLTSGVAKLGNYVYFGITQALKVVDPTACLASRHVRPVARPE